MQEEHSSSVDHHSTCCGTTETEDVSLKCPLCCTMTFSTRETLAEHLSNTIKNLTCSICTNNFTSINQLIDHLSLENCVQHQSAEPDQLRTILLENGQSEGNDFKSNSPLLLGYRNDSDPSSLLLPQGSVSTHDTEDHVYTHIMKPLPTQELFVKEGDSQYMILTQDQDGPIVTKQNNDGTISLTSVKDMKMEVSEADPLLSQEAAEDSDDGLYSCNTCGVSFTSVIEHIQNYHNDQDVVVEEPMDDDNQMPIDYDTAPVEKQVPRRVITDTGDIVEAPPLDKNSSEDSQSEFETTPFQKEPEKSAGPGSKRYLRMNNLCDSVIMDLKADQKKGPNHKVMIKEVMTKEGEKIKMYHCMFCNVYVSSLNDFKQHPCKTSKYSCLQCPVSYDNAKSLCAHMKVHKVKTGNLEVIESYECDICGTVFPTNKSLKLHRRMHDPVKQRQIEAPRNSSFSEMRFRCSVCEKLIPIDYRDIHNNSHKNEEKMLNCGICNKKFTSEEYLEMHMNVHNLEKAPMSKQDQSLPYQCLYCDRRFARPHEKVKHERIHTGEKPHSCEICGKSFRVSYCLTLHMRTHTGARPYACKHCGKRFKAHSVYNHHLLTHSDVRAYKCPYCPKAFKTSVQLAGHKNSHTKPFSCTQCNRPFASLYAVRVHTETHNRSNNLKFSCALCGASYARAFALKDHMKQAHKQDIKKEILTEQNDWVIQPQGTTDDTDIKSNLHSLNKDIAVAINQLDDDEPPSEFSP